MEPFGFQLLDLQPIGDFRLEIASVEAEKRQRPGEILRTGFTGDALKFPPFAVEPEGLHFRHLSRKRHTGALPLVAVVVGGEQRKFDRHRGEVAQTDGKSGGAADLPVQVEPGAVEPLAGDEAPENSTVFRMEFQRLEPLLRPEIPQRTALLRRIISRAVKPFSGGRKGGKNAEHGQETCGDR